MPIMPPLKAGNRTIILGEAGTPESDQLAVNEAIAGFEKEAWSAGFITETKSVAYSGGRIVILLSLSDDPSFSPPM